jgi:branched-chain amino acid transport system ATP-binding protein
MYILEKKALLKIENCWVYYHKALALEDISLEVMEGEAVSILGANGAGKTTIIRLILGFKKPTKGGVFFNNESISGLPPHRIVARGISISPEGMSLASEMTVMENLEMGAYLIKSRQVKKDTLHEIFEMFPVLYQRRNQLAGTLSGGERQMVGLGRAFMSKPKLLILDEPSLGLAPLVRKEIFKQIAKIKLKHLSVLLAEQEATLGLTVTDRCYIIENGKNVLSGNSKEMISNDFVQRVYLGMG